ncbi:MAG: transglutaminase-like cysteine peptidase [Sulfuricella denitrificans]|nr:transglutaminase-like cysteine peptidase [Sulfuricella denitrificans]
MATALDFDRLLNTITQRFGENASRNFHAWKKLLTETKDLETPEKLKRVNEFFNRHIRFMDDQQIWSQSDYWATPMETLGKGAGDCEDFTIAKYYTLLNLGVPNEKLRLIYVKARIGGMNSNINQAHMVLAYYRDSQDEPLILDNLITEIRPAGRRPDLTPIFSFNNKEIWQGSSQGSTAGSGGTGSLSRWDDLLKRARAEGFD